MSDLVGNPEDRFSHNEARLVQYVNTPMQYAEIFMHLSLFFPRRGGGDTRGIVQQKNPDLLE